MEGSRNCCTCMHALRLKPHAVSLPRCSDWTLQACVAFAIASKQQSHYQAAGMFAVLYTIHPKEGRFPGPRMHCRKVCWRETAGGKMIEGAQACLAL